MYDKQKQKEYQKEHFCKNKEAYYKSRFERKRRNKEYAHNLKIECSCGEKDKSCLDFHHTNNKIKSIAQLICDAASIKKLQDEINKCYVVCGNCHSKQHRPATIEDGSNWRNFTKSRIKKRRWFVNFINESKCDNCGENDSRCLEFHHIGEKRFKISYLLTSGHSLDYLKEEMVRCKILCVNCHRKLHSMVSIV